MDRIMAATVAQVIPTLLLALAVEARVFRGFVLRRGWPGRIAATAILLLAAYVEAATLVVLAGAGHLPGDQPIAIATIGLLMGMMTIVALGGPMRDPDLPDRE